MQVKNIKLVDISLFLKDDKHNCDIENGYNKKCIIFFLFSLLQKCTRYASDTH